MILESKISDASKVTFDCAKATIERGSRIEIADIHWKSIEIQNALRMNLIAIVGQPPVFPEEALGISAEKKIRFINNYETKLCFECIKDYAAPGGVVHVPVSLLDEPEIRNAIHAGWLLNLDHPEDNPVVSSGEPVYLEELTVKDIVGKPRFGLDDLVGSPSAMLAEIANLPPAKPQPIPEGVPTKRPSKKVASQIKAKKIATAGEREDEGGEDESGGLYKSSEIIVPTKKKSKAAQAPAPLIVEDSDGDDSEFDISDFFSNNQPKGKKE